MFHGGCVLISMLFTSNENNGGVSGGTERLISLTWVWNT